MRNKTYEYAGTGGAVCRSFDLVTGNDLRPLAGSEVEFVNFPNPGCKGCPGQQPGVGHIISVALTASSIDLGICIHRRWLGVVQP